MHDGFLLRCSQAALQVFKLLEALVLEPLLALQSPLRPPNSRPSTPVQALA